MAQSITQKILACHSSRKEVEPGEYILADADLFLGNDVTAPLAIKESSSLKFTRASRLG